MAGRSDDIEHQADTVKQTIEAFGRIDLLVNNTGINPVYGPMVDLDLDAARKTFEGNCLAALLWVQQVHRGWMGERGGSVVNVSSVAGLKPAPGIGSYDATKAMLSHITQEFAVELGPDIHVNAVAPAVVKTRFATALYQDREDEVAPAYPLKRLGVPSDIGSVVAFLLSEDAPWMTGQVLVIDGGVTLTGASEMDVRGVALTGVGHGVGRAIVCRMAAVGARVVANDIDGEAGSAVAAEVGGQAAGGEAPRQRAPRPRCCPHGLKRLGQPEDIAASLALCQGKAVLAVLCLRPGHQKSGPASIGALVSAIMSPVAPRE
ncbi:glucose 1-dehydrogenase [Micromonospora sp. NPDC050686]|uniref:SDR family oxidoreductase n=1 Tax=Micromonospora sp. NPDC050686 TaxID=3154631 RepID=UPI0033CDA9DC